MDVLGPRIGWRFASIGVLVSALSLAHAGEADFARVIVRLKPDATVLRSTLVQAQSATGVSQLSNPMGRLGARRGLTVVDGRDIGNHMHVAMARGLSSEALAASLSKDSDVLYAEPDRMRRPQSFPAGVPDDPLFSNVGNAFVNAGQWYLRAHDDVLFKSAINAQAAWSLATGSGVTVAVLDSGVRFDHPDLSAKLYAGYNMISYSAVSQVSSGRGADASDLGDWVTSDDVTAINAQLGGATGCVEQVDSEWHGTQVAGIIGAQTNNGIGMAAVAPDARILPVRVLGKCGGWDSDILDGMRWAAGLSVIGATSASHPAKVLNLSLGAAGSCPQSYRDVVAELAALTPPVVVVASAGNAVGLAVTTPADCPGVIAVTGVRHLGSKVKYSSVGPEVSLAAPGGNCVNTTGPCLYPILTTSNTGLTTPVANNAVPTGSTYTGSSYVTGGAQAPSLGTSFAAPQVSGAVALMLEARPSLTPGAVRSLLMATARTFPVSGGTSGTTACHLPNGTTQDECYCTQLTCGAGMLDVNAAVQAAATNAVAVITKTPDSPQPTQVIHFSGAQSMVSTSQGASSLSYHWSLLDGGGIVSSSGWSADSVDLDVTPTASGVFQVRLTVVDDQGQSAHSDQWIVVGQGGSSGSTSANSGNTSSGGGGGSVSPHELVALGLIWAVVGLSSRRGAIKA